MNATDYEESPILYGEGRYRIKVPWNRSGFRDNPWGWRGWESNEGTPYREAKPAPGWDKMKEIRERISEDKRVDKIEGWKREEREENGEWLWKRRKSGRYAVESGPPWKWTVSILEIKEIKKFQWNELTWRAYNLIRYMTITFTVWITISLLIHR